MKKKYITLALIFLTQLCVFAQEWTGTFSTKYGDLKLVTENGIIYGDYANGGTILAVEKKFNGGSRLCGLFHNGADRGRFYFEKTTSSKNIRGHFNYDNNITLNDITNDAIFTMKFDFDAKWLWDGTKANNTSPTDTKTAVFNGLWNTTDGNLILQQVGNKVTGTYKNIGTVDGVYNPQTRKLKGTFYNNTTKKTGHFEFDFEGNTFKGKWGWTAAMTDGNWNGTKNVKNNKAIATTSTSTNVQQGLNSNSNNQNPVQDDFIKIRVRAVYAEGRTSDGITFKGNLDLYGFVRFELKKLTASSSTLVKSFGDKSKYLFEKTEDSPLIVRARSYQFPNDPTYYRDYIISKSDWENNNIQFELTVGHHLKVVAVGSNLFCEKQNEIISLKKANILNKQHRTRNDSDSARYIGGCFLDFYIEKLN